MGFSNEVHGEIFFACYAPTEDYFESGRRSNITKCLEYLRQHGLALEIFRALGIEFVSLSENVDTSTPMDRMVFAVLGAVAELERSIIVERVKAGLRNARAKGRPLGRPRVSVSATRIGLRREGLTLRDIARLCRVSKTTVIRALK
jgi:DNA invertase Pin-like site-specific DNA recombinase